MIYGKIKYPPMLHIDGQPRELTPLEPYMYVYGAFVNSEWIPDSMTDEEGDRYESFLHNKYIVCTRNREVQQCSDGIFRVTGGEEFGLVITTKEELLAYFDRATARERIAQKAFDTVWNRRHHTPSFKTSTKRARRIQG